MRHTFVIGLGSNLGVRGQNLASAVQAQARLTGIAVSAVSRVYETEALGPPQPPYLNAAVQLTTALAPEALLDALHAIENAFGRTRDVHCGPRVLDLDILWASKSLASERLTVPHAQLLLRTFALAPLLDVAPELAPSYADALQQLGGAPFVRGALHFDRASGACAFSDATAL
jgi:2-amino-4-hydroxy-6-hydroxymethyldihydropteridine diphosphokinase